MVGNSAKPNRRHLHHLATEGVARNLSPAAGQALLLGAFRRPIARRRRAAFVINSLAGGGAERVMCTLLRASGVERDQFDVALILLDREASAYDVPDWVELVRLDSRHSLLRSLIFVTRALRRLRPDVTVSFLTRANVANVLAASLLGIRAIVSERVNTSTHLGRGMGAALAKLLVKWTYPRAGRIIAVSQGVADDLQRSFGVPESKIAVIANPIDVDSIRAQAAQPFAVPIEGPYVMAMGRLVPNKNFRMLIDAFAQSGLDGTLLILGEGPERDALQDQARALGLAGRVVMPGFAANPFPALRGATLFVLPSNAEGFPNSLLEAMSVGVPVISTNCPSGPAEVLAGTAREQIAPGVCLADHGVLVPPDDPSAMAQALRAMMDPMRLRHYREKAAMRAADFSVTRAKDAYWSVIRAQLPSVGD